MKRINENLGPVRPKLLISLLAAAVGLVTAAYADKDVLPASPAGSYCSVGGVVGTSAWKESKACGTPSGSCWVCQGNSIAPLPSPGPGWIIGPLPIGYLPVVFAPVTAAPAK